MTTDQITPEQKAAFLPKMASGFFSQTLIDQPPAGGRNQR